MPALPRRPFRFSLRTILFAVTIVCIATMAGIALLTRITRGLNVVVTNESNVALQELAILYFDTHSQLNDLAPGKSHRLPIRPRGESGLSLRYEWDGALKEAPANVYLEPGYSGVVYFTIQNDGTTLIESDIDIY